MIFLYRIAVLSRPLDFLCILINYFTRKIERSNFEKTYFSRKKISAQSFPQNYTWTLSGFGLADCFRCSSIFFNRAICCLSDKGTIRPDGATKFTLWKAPMLQPNSCIFHRSFLRCFIFECFRRFIIWSTFCMTDKHISWKINFSWRIKNLI